MRTLVAAFLISVALAAAITPLVRQVALRVGAVSSPGGRHLHARSIPRLGGIAILLALLGPIVGLLLVESTVADLMRQAVMRWSMLLIGGVVMCAVGALDDTRRLRAVVKLYAQVAVAVLAWVGGFRIMAIEVPFFGELSMGIFALPVTVAWIVGVTNAINLIDGLDGLAAGIVFFAALTNLVVAYVSGATLVAVFMACTLGSVLGFLIYNFNPARIFMGDSGSYLLGFILATTSLAGSSQKASTAVSILVPMLALGVPIFDTLSTMVRRYLERRSLFSPDRGHIHHRLLDMGLTHRRAVLLLYGASFLFAAAAIGISLGRNWAVGTVLLIMSVVATGTLRFASGFARSFGDRRQKSRLRSRHAEVLRGLVLTLPARFAAARTEVDVWAALQAVLEAAHLERAEVLDAPETHEGQVVRTIANGALARSPDEELVRARYPLGADRLAKASIRFWWRAEQGEVSPQEEVLLQLVVDACAARLSELGSAWGPAPISIPTPARVSVTAHTAS